VPIEKHRVMLFKLSNNLKAYMKGESVKEGD
jgi:hypothetical protein